MAYHIYTTEGIVLKRTFFGEANLMLYVLTEDLGLIIASAQAARLAKSKLRSALQEYSLVSISCVKGKNGWKITNAIEKKNYFFSSPLYCRKIFSQVSAVLQKMITGEIPHKEIFQTIKSGFDFLGGLDKDNIHNFEILVVLRVLYELGYVAKTQQTNIFLEKNNEWGDGILNNVSKNNKNLVSLINKALKESQL